MHGWYAILAGAAEVVLFALGAVVLLAATALL